MLSYGQIGLLVGKALLAGTTAQASLTDRVNTALYWSTTAPRCPEAESYTMTQEFVLPLLYFRHLNIPQVFIYC